MKTSPPNMPLFEYDPEFFKFRKTKQPFCVIHYYCSVCGRTEAIKGRCMVSATGRDVCVPCNQEHAILWICEEHGSTLHGEWFGDGDEDGEFWYPKPGIVYVIQAGKTNLYKIGASEKDVSLRLKALQTGCPHKLSVFREIAADNCTEREKQLHGFLTSYRVHGEWFEIPDESILTEAINGIAWDMQ